MARIETYSTQEGPQRTSTSAPQLSNAMGQELESFGGEVSNVGAMLVQRAQQREDFETENNYRKLQLDLEKDLNDRAATIEEGGANFHDGFVAEVFKPKRDEFLAGVPDRLRPKFETLLADDTGADTAAWSINAARVERDESYRWYKQEIGAAQTDLTQGIELDPDNYNAYLARGEELINTSGLPTSEKALLREQWTQMAMTANLNRLLQDDPEGVIRELGGDPRNLSPTTQFAVLSRAVQWQESSDNPNAVSPKGAIGLMQVMPGTAAEIAVALGDESFPTGAPDNVVRAYLSNPVVNKRYGEAYLKQQLRTFANTRNPIETALVAYNAGPGTAQKWVESGYDDKVLPAETRKYKKEIMASLVAPGAKGDPSKVNFVMTNGREMGAVVPELKNRVQDAFATLGLSTVKVNSGFRDEATNKAVGGADDSRHKHGDAMDIDVSGMSHAKRIELIKSLSAAGITGLGIGANVIHADLGGRRAWGYATSAGGGEVPEWAAGVIAEHLQGTAPPPRAVGSRYAALEYDKRQQFLSKADTLVSQQLAASTKTDASLKVQVRNARDNELATIRATGQGSASFDETQISTVLGEDDYLTFTERRDVARRTYTAVSDIATLAPEALEQRVNDYEPIAGSPDFAKQTEVQAAVQKEVNRVINLRAKNPDQAAMEYPEVKGAYAALQETMSTGDPRPEEVQSFVKLMLEKQADFDVAPDARAPIPHDWAVEIGRSLTRVPAPARGNSPEIKATIAAQYNALKAFFGDYTDEVLIYSLSEYKGLSKPTAEMVGGMMKAIQAGGDPFRAKQVDSTLDQDQVDWFSQEPLVRGVKRLFGIDPDATAEPVDDAALSPEELLRRQTSEEP